MNQLNVNSFHPKLLTFFILILYFYFILRTLTLTLKRNLKYNRIT